MSEKILIIDDHVETVNLVSAILSRQGYAVFTAHSGPDGLEQAGHIFPDLVLLDVMMPEMDGYEVCKLMRKRPYLKDTPIIMFTAKSQPGEKWEGFQAGATDYLIKPTNTDELSKRVRTILDRSAEQKIPDAPIPGESKGQTALVGNALPEGQLVGVLGVRGGCGTTTTAVNIAFSLAKAKTNTLLVDLDMAQGHISLYLNRQSSKAINALSGRDSMVLQRELNQQTITVNDHLDLLLALPNAANKRQIPLDEQLTDMIYGLSQAHRQVIIDLGHGITPANTPFLAKVDTLLVCMQPERISVSAARQMLRGLEDVMFPGSTLLTLMLSFNQGMNLPAKAVEKYIGYPINHVININPDDFTQAVNSARPLAMSYPDAPAAQMFAKIAKQLQPVAP
ncbi:MAG: response regulator [Anaerolineales bacterium]|nr:response regulator [Anaerolineales bacterium]